MSEFKGTPGPWKVEPCPYTPDRGSVFVEGPGGWDRDPVCSTYETSERETNEANARLIAAAPDLLAALQAAKQYGSQGTTDDGISVDYLIETAIRRATETGDQS